MVIYGLKQADFSSQLVADLVQQVLQEDCSGLSKQQGFL